MTRVVPDRLRRAVDRLTVTVLIAADLLIGAVWVLGDESRTTAGAYTVAQQLAPQPTYGAVLILLTCGVLALHRWTPAPTTLAWAGLGAYWAWWAVLTCIVALTTDTASAYGPATAGVMAAVHIGTALTREG